MTEPVTLAQQIAAIEYKVAAARFLVGGMKKAGPPRPGAAERGGMSLEAAEADLAALEAALVTLKAHEALVSRVAQLEENVSSAEDAIAMLGDEAGATHE